MKLEGIQISISIVGRDRDKRRSRTLCSPPCSPEAQFLQWQKPKMARKHLHGTPWHTSDRSIVALHLSFLQCFCLKSAPRCSQNAAPEIVTTANASWRSYIILKASVRFFSTKNITFKTVLYYFNMQTCLYILCTCLRNAWIYAVLTTVICHVNWKYNAGGIYFMNSQLAYFV